MLNTQHSTLKGGTSNIERRRGTHGRDAVPLLLILRSPAGRAMCIIIMPTEDDIKNALKAVKYPGFSRDIVSFGLIKEISSNNGAVSVSMEITGSPEVGQQIKAESERVLKTLPGVNAAFVQVKQKAGA